MWEAAIFIIISSLVWFVIVDITLYKTLPKAPNEPAEVPFSGTIAADESTSKAIGADEITSKAIADELPTVTTVYVENINPDKLKSGSIQFKSKEPECTDQEERENE